MLTTFSVMGALASITSLISVVLASPLSGGEAAIPAALHPSAMDQSTSHSPAHSTLKPRYDYEPGDELKRTMCFCTSEPSLEQLDNDPYTFKNVSADHQIGTVYQFEYYNHRLKNWFTITTHKTCRTESGRRKDYYWHNSCLHWNTQHQDYCSHFSVSSPPAGISASQDWEFCYKFRGDSLDADEDTKDEFTFATDSRVLPRTRDSIGGEAEVEAKCTEWCRGAVGMDLFRSKTGGWFNREDSFHHFEDICGDHMDCGHGPGHVNPHHLPPPGGDSDEGEPN